MDEQKYNLVQSLAELDKLVGLSAKETDKTVYEDLVEKARIIYEQYPESEDIALRYINTLSKLADKQTEFEEVNRTVEKVKIIYEKFRNSEEIASWYVAALSNSADKQTEIGEVNRTVEKVKIIYEKFHNSEEIASWYAGALSKLADKQTEIGELRHTVKQICDILKSIPSVKSFATLVKILEKNPDTPLDTNNTPSTSLTKILDKLCFYSNEDLDRKLLIRALNLDLVINTKYDILKNWIEHYGEDSKKINKLIKIYTLVQQIKYELGLKAEDKNRKLKFGHYTSGEALQSILGKKDTAPFSISGKTRLNNANYMNDPEEGVILEKILNLEKRNPLEPSSWFLMSFTSKTDDLAMWSQYGNNAEGICIVLKENDFARYHSLSDLPWYQKNSDKQIGHKMKSSVEIQNDNSLNESDKEKSTRGNESVQNYEDKHSTLNNDTDYLYRVAYVHYSNDQFDIEESELFTNEEVTRLKELLEDLKSELRNYKNSEDSFYKKAIADCIEEIRYLFKSVDYKYEEELRILQYANLIPDNNKIKIDYSPEFGKLYLERKENIQIDEVIFGPKFPNPEYVTPLLKLLDKEIKYKKSTIKFR